MKRTITILLFLLSMPLLGIAQNEVTLTTVGEGSTKDMAIKVALRSALEQCFGTYISAKTEIINNLLIKDEIISISNGNISKYKVLNEEKIPNGNYLIVVNATVSTGKLVSFCKANGAEVEVNGSAFTSNIKLAEINESNELIAIQNILKILGEMPGGFYDYEINTSEPKLINNYNKKQALLDISINIKETKNVQNYIDFLINSLDAISIKKSEIEAIQKLNLPFYGIKVKKYRNKSDYEYLIFRNENSLNLIKKAFMYLQRNMFYVQINDGEKVDLFIYLMKILIDKRKQAGCPLNVSGDVTKLMDKINHYSSAQEDVFHALYLKVLDECIDRQFRNIEECQSKIFNYQGSNFIEPIYEQLKKRNPFDELYNAKYIIYPTSGSIMRLSFEKRYSIEDIEKISKITLEPY